MYYETAMTEHNIYKFGIEHIKYYKKKCKIYIKILFDYEFLFYMLLCACFI